MFKGGYHGKILNIDLSTWVITEEPLAEDEARLFIGTYGLGARLLYSRMAGGTDPLGADSILGFIPGPLTGTGSLFGGRFSVVCKSPINQGWNDANCGGHFGPELKKAGFDAVLIRGISAKPVYLWIHDGQAELRDAGHLWGKDCPETEEALANELGDAKVSAAVIGLPGEQCAWLAGIMNDRHRAAARGGVGAVMGSKRLKAVVAHGTGKVPIADENGLRETNRFIMDMMKNGPEWGTAMGFGMQGTGMGNVYGVMVGDTPIKNWGGIGTIDYEGEAMDVGTLDKRFKYKRYACASCPMGCGADYDIKDGQYPIGKTNRPEYETVHAFGGLVLNEDPEVMIKCNELCNRAGIDTISTGATIAWAIECAENGLFSPEELEGLDLGWGKGTAILELTQQITEMRSFGRKLANGSQAAAKSFNRGFEYLVTVRGIELPMHDPKATPGYARTYQVDPTPGRHVKPGFAYIQQMGMDDEIKWDFSNTGENDKKASAALEFVYITGSCEFVRIPGTVDAPMRLMEAVTGWNYSEQERMEASLRSLNMRQSFNLREGILPKDATIPRRVIGDPPQKTGPNEGKTVDAEALKRNFFQAMEWDLETGKPSRKSLEQLGGFDDVIRDLYG